MNVTVFPFVKPLPSVATTDSGPMGTAGTSNVHPVCVPVPSVVQGDGDVTATPSILNVM